MADKFCANCGAQNSEAGKFCPGCGMQTVPAGTPMASAPPTPLTYSPPVLTSDSLPQQPYPQQYPAAPPPGEKKKGKALIIGGVALAIVGRNIVNALIMAGIGAAFFLIGLYILRNPTVPDEFAAQTKAVITDMQKYNTSNGTSYHVTVSFTVDGRKYGGRLGSYSSSMQLGKEIDIVYDTRDPSNFSQSGSNKFMGGIFMLLGGVAFLCSIPVLFGRGRGRSRSRMQLGGVTIRR